MNTSTQLQESSPTYTRNSDQISAIQNAKYLRRAGFTTYRIARLLHTNPIQVMQWLEDDVVIQTRRKK